MSGSGFTRRPRSSSFLWFIFRILEGNPKKELLRGLWANHTCHNLDPKPQVSRSPKNEVNENDWTGPRQTPDAKLTAQHATTFYRFLNGGGLGFRSLGLGPGFPKP